MKPGNILSTIGRTPLVALKRITADCHARIFVKLEMFNPCGSIKERIALNMINEAERMGQLKHGMSVIEATSGNTGIGLAMVCAARGYPLTLTMPETMSLERRKILRFLGAEILLSSGSSGMTGAVEMARDLVKKNPETWYMPCQFENPANPAAHEMGTGPEIWSDTNGFIDIFVAGVGTGGTITGVTRYLKSVNPCLVSVAVEPAASAVLSGGQPGPHGIQGIGAGFIPGIVDVDCIDRVVTVRDEDAVSMTRRLSLEEGIFAGLSGGAAVWAARELALLPENKGKRIVTILPDSGERYLSILRID